MKELTITKSEYTPSDNDLKIFEKNLGFVIPEKYKEFLLKFNPKYVKESLFKKGDREFWLEGFHPFIQNGISGSLQYVYSIFCPDVLPKEYLSFGYDAGGWQFIICIEGENYGKIFFCRMDEEFDDALTLLADNFDKFITGLEDVSSQPA